MTEPTPHERYLALMDEAIAEWLRTEKVFRSVTAEYRTGARSRPDELAAIADRRAASDQRMKNAVADGQWHRDRAQTFGIAAIAHREVQG